MSGSSRKYEYLQDRSQRGPNAFGTVVSPSHGGSRITALHIEFVAKPSEAHKVHSALPSAIHGAMEGVAGFAGSFVMVANYEARLVTVVTLWAGDDRARRCDENIRWMRALLAPYLDRCLRVQTLATYLPPANEAAQESESCGVLQSMEMPSEAGMSAFVA